MYTDNRTTTARFDLTYHLTWYCWPPLLAHMLAFLHDAEVRCQGLCSQTVLPLLHIATQCFQTAQQLAATRGRVLAQNVPRMYKQKPPPTTRSLHLSGPSWGKGHLTMKIYILIYIYNIDRERIIKAKVKYYKIV